MEKVYFLYLYAVRKHSYWDANGKHEFSWRYPKALICGRRNPSGGADIITVSDEESSTHPLQARFRDMNKRVARSIVTGRIDSRSKHVSSFEEFTSMLNAEFPTATSVERMRDFWQWVVDEHQHERAA